MVDEGETTMESESNRTYDFFFFCFSRRLNDFVLSNSPIPPPLPDFYIVEDGLNYTKKGEKKHFTVQNRYGQFKMVIFLFNNEMKFLITKF